MGRVYHHKIPTQPANNSTPGPSKHQMICVVQEWMDGVLFKKNIKMEVTPTHQGVFFFF